MHIHRGRSPRRLAVLAVAALAVVAACTPTGPPGEPPTPAGEGFRLKNPELTKLWPDGYKIILFDPAGDPSAQAIHDDLVPLMKNAALQLQAHTGLAFSYNPSPWYGDYGDTVFPSLIAVNLVDKADWPCSPTYHACAAVSTSAEGRVGSGRVALRTDYVVKELAKPDGAGMAELHTTILHEFGHTLNLTHYNSLFDDGNGGTEWQTMASSTPGNSRDYRLGDRNGLRYMAAGSR